MKPEEVLAKAAKIYGEKPGEVLKAGKRESEARDAAIYLMKRKSGMSSMEIGEKMGVGASAVGNRIAMVKKRMEGETRFKARIDNIK